MSQSSQQTPSQFQVTGCSQSPQGYIRFVLGPGFCSMSPASISIKIAIEWFLHGLTGNVSGLRPADVHLLFNKLDIRWRCSHDFSLEIDFPIWYRSITAINVVIILILGFSV